MHCCREAFKCPFKGRACRRAAGLQTQRTQRPRDRVTRQNPESQISPFRSTCSLLIWLIRAVKPDFPFQRACLRRRWALTRMTALQENSSLWCAELEIEPVSPAYQHISPLAPAAQVRCIYVLSGGIRPEPQRWSHQRASNTREQTDCKRPSLYKWSQSTLLYLDLFGLICLCTTQLRTWRESEHDFFFLFPLPLEYAARWCRDI